MTPATTKKSLLRQIAGALVWATFFVFAPVGEFVVLGVIIWLPLFIWCERRRTVRYGFFPGAAWRFGVIALAIVGAAYAPTKEEDARVGPLSSTTVTIGELADEDIVSRFLLERELRDRRVTLPSLRPTRREVMRAISAQPGMRASVYKCGNGCNLLFGSYGGPIRVDKT